MAETKLQTDTVVRARGVPVTLLPCDWTSTLTEFKKKYGSHIADDRLAAQSMFENFTGKLADGTLKAEPLEEEQQDLEKPEPAANTIYSSIPDSLLRLRGATSVRNWSMKRDSV